jgi:hypothetical protein
MNLSESLVLLEASVVLLYFGRGRGGDSHPILQRCHWVVGQLFALSILCLFFASLIGIVKNFGLL